MDVDSCLIKFSYRLAILGSSGTGKSELCKSLVVNHEKCTKGASRNHQFLWCFATTPPDIKNVKVRFHQGLPLYDDLVALSESVDSSITVIFDDLYDQFLALPTEEKIGYTNLIIEKSRKSRIGCK